MQLTREGVPLPPPVEALFAAAAPFADADATLLVFCFVLLSTVGSPVDFSVRTGTFGPLVVLMFFLFSTFDAAFFSGTVLIGIVD